ncbi:uncharacterized protein METZ01_LOCUS14256, partial [marine metagenome]
VSCVSAGDFTLPKTVELVGTPGGSAAVIVGHQLKETVSVRNSDSRVRD